MTNNNGNGGAESGKSGGNHAKPRRMSHIDDEKSLGFAASSANVTAEVKVKAKAGTTAAPAQRVSRVASDAAGSSSGSIKGKVSCLQGCSSGEDIRLGSHT